MKTFRMVTCPKCGKRFKENYAKQALRYTEGTAEFAVRGVTHFGARFLGGSLGAIFGSNGAHMVSHAFGEAAGKIVGGLDDPIKSAQLRCPFCGHVW